MKNIKFSMYLFFVSLYATPLFAQQINIEKEFKQMQAAYQKNEYLSYDVQYLYAKESAPAVYIDTVNGSYKINQNRYWGRLDNVEYVQTDSAFISIYEEDKVILLNSSAPVWLKTHINWDSVWRNAKGKIDLSISRDEGFNKVSMSYPKDSVYKRIDFWYSPVDFRIQKMQYVLRQPDDLMEEINGGNNAVSSDEFVIIEIRFSNYNTTAFDKEIFVTEKYVEKRGNEFQPSIKYIDYTVLVGSPGLLN
jgi:hypothetical protein